MSPSQPAPGRLPPRLLGIFAIAWIALAIQPRYRQDWALENVVVVVALAVLVFSYRRRPLRDGTYIVLFVFLLLHEVGAHYTYSEVPYDRWSRALFGVSPDAALGLSRNHYDRVLHLLYGIAVGPAVFEWLAPSLPAHGPSRYTLPIAVVMASSVLYELIEWAAALVFGGDLGVAYLGTQGDPWDAQQDMLLASVGGIVGVAGCGLLSRSRRGGSGAHAV